MAMNDRNDNFDSDARRGKALPMELSKLPEYIKELRRNIISELGAHTSVDPLNVKLHNRAWGSCVPGTLLMIGILWLNGERRFHPIVTRDPHARGQLQDHMVILERETSMVLDLTPAAAKAGKLPYLEDEQEQLWYKLLSNPTLQLRMEVLIARYNEKHSTHYTFGQILSAAHQSFYARIQYQTDAHNKQDS